MSTCIRIAVKRAERDSTPPFCRKSSPTTSPSDELQSNRQEAAATLAVSCSNSWAVIAKRCGVESAAAGVRTLRSGATGLQRWQRQVAARHSASMFSYGMLSCPAPYSRAKAWCAPTMTSPAKGAKRSPRSPTERHGTCDCLL